MSKIFADYALINGQIKENILVETANGVIDSVVNISKKPNDDSVIYHKNCLLMPALNNSHSHGFQRAMAGLSEYRQGNSDNFWSWRNLMYHFLQYLTPEDIGHITQYAYLEMVKSGFCSVAEFHYLHNQNGGQHYDNLGLLSEVIIEAAQNVGIALTLLPVVYQQANPRGEECSGGQLRFTLNNDQYMRLWQGLQQYAGDNMHLGLAIHSLRAVPLAHIKQIYQNIGGLCHIHIGEQRREEEEIVAHYGQRPLNLLADGVGLNKNWALVHGNCFDDGDIKRVVDAGAILVACPLTEANLGDGFCKTREFLQLGGQLAIGTDSHIHINMPHEIQMLEYAMRLRDKERVVLADNNIGQGHLGINILEKIYRGGALANARHNGCIERGFRADFLWLNGNHRQLMHKKPIFWPDSMIVTPDKNMIRNVMVNGQMIIDNGLHNNEKNIKKNYQKTMKKLMERL